MVQLFVLLGLSSTAFGAAPGQLSTATNARPTLEFAKGSATTVTGGHQVVSQSGAGNSACMGDCGDGEMTEEVWDLSGAYRLTSTGGTAVVTLPNLRGNTNGLYNESWCGTAEADSKFSVLGSYTSVVENSGIRISHGITEFLQAEAEASEGDFWTNCLPSAYGSSFHETVGPVTFEIPFTLTNTDYVNVSTSVNFSAIESGELDQAVQLRLTVTNSPDIVECRVGGADQPDTCSRVSRIGRGEHILIVEYSLDSRVWADDINSTFSKLLSSGSFTAALKPVSGN